MSRGAETQSDGLGWGGFGVNRARPCLGSHVCGPRHVFFVWTTRGDGGSYTFTWNSMLVFPANGKRIAEVQDWIQTFPPTFKLKNISRLGTPMPAK